MLLRAFRLVFRRYQAVTIAIGTALVIFTLALWLPNISFVFSQLQSGGTFSEKLHFVWSFYGAIETAHTTYSARMAFLIAMLSGVNVAMLVHYISRAKQSIKTRARISAGSFAGVVAGVLGIGCAACGSVILTGLLATVGAGGLLYLLPFGGAEVGIVAVLLLMVSMYLLAKRITDPLVCRA